MDRALGEFLALQVLLMQLRSLLLHALERENTLLRGLKRRRKGGGRRRVRRAVQGGI